jgi:hypothetical protein
MCISACQNDLIEDDFSGEWTYHRDLSITFENLSDYDFDGIIIFNNDHTGQWNEENGDYNYDIEWHFNESTQSIKILKYDQDQNLELKETSVFNVCQLDDETLMLEFREEKQSFLQPNNYIVTYEEIEITKK